MALIPSLKCPKWTLRCQWIAGIAGMLMMFVMGLSIGWNSPYLAQFTSGGSPYPATVNEVSWMALLLHVGRIPGAILGAICVEYFGSKTVMIGNGCLALASWILVILANSASYILVSRFICGATAEIAVVSFPLFLGDIGSSKIRGALVMLAGNGMPLGIVAGNTMGYYISMKLFACIALIPTICFLLILIWIPHSPYYLIKNGNMKNAKRAILAYNSKANVQVEMESIKKFLAISTSKTFMDRLREFNIPRNRKVGIVLVSVYMFLGFSGMSSLTAYMESIITRGRVTAIAPAVVPIIANSIGIISGWVMMFFADKLGRKMMWIVSSAGLCSALTLLGTHFYLIGDGFDPVGLQWLPIFSVLTYKIFYNVGMHTVPSILFSELFAANIRTLGACVVGIAASIFGVLSIYAYQLLIELVAEAYVWWIHAIVMLISLIFGLLLVPETKGKTLLEIQDGLMKS